MTFTYTPSTPTDRDRIRYAIADTDSTAAMFSDEVIAFRLAECSDWKHAVIDLLLGKIAELANTPDFSAGNLRINSQGSRDTLMKLLAEKRREYGIPQLTATAVYTYRPDGTAFTEAPTYDPVED